MERLFGEDGPVMYRELCTYVYWVAGSVLFLLPVPQWTEPLLLMAVQYFMHEIQTSTYMYKHSGLVYTDIMVCTEI